MEESAVTRLALDGAVRIVRLANERIQIRTPCERLTIGRQARLAGELIRLCDGTRSMDEIVSLLVSAGHAEQTIRQLGSLLLRKAVLTGTTQSVATDTLLLHARHFARRAAGDSVPALPESQGRPVLVLGTGRLARAVRRGLGHLHIRQVEAVAAGDGEIGLTVACSDYEAELAFRQHNRTGIAARIPMLFACIAEASVRVGPFVVPGDTSCFECFYHRLRANVTFREELDAFLASEASLEETGADSHAAIYAGLASALVCAQVANFLCGALHHCLFDRLLDLCPVTLEAAVSRVLKLPRCEVCGSTSASPLPASRDWV